MTEPTEQTGTERKSTIMDALRRPIYALGVLMIVWFLFGQVVPRILFSDSYNPIDPAPTAPANTEQKAEIAALNERVSQLEARLKTYEEVITALPKDAPAPVDNSEWQAEMEAKIEALAKHNEAVVDSERLAALEARINNQQSAFATIQMQADEKVALITAFSQMKDAVLRGDRFSSQYNAFGALVHERPDIKDLLSQLAPYSVKGIVTLNEAQKQFETLAPKALAPKNNNSFLGNMGSLITIRKVGEPKGNDDEAVIARSEAKLSRGDTDGALKELSQLSPPAASVFADWVNAVQAGARAREILDALQLALVQDKAPVIATEPAKATQ